MKKISRISLLLIFLSVFLTSSYAIADDDIGSGAPDDLMKYTQSVDNAFLGQKKITDEEFQKTVQELKEKRAKKQHKKTQLKGKNYNDENSGSYIHETAEKNIILCVPLSLTNEDGVEIPIGHYKIVGEKVQDQIYLDFYQSSELVAKVPAKETKNDYNEMEINFVKLMPYSDRHVKVIFGSMDFNAYAYIRIKQQESTESPQL